MTETREDSAWGEGQWLPAPGQIVTWGLIFLGLYLCSLVSYNLFHSLAELFSVVVAGGIFMVAWNTRRVSSNTYIMFLGVAFLAVGSLDLLHTLTYKGLNALPGFSADVPTQFWIASRYLEALSLVVAVYFVDHQPHPTRLLAAYGLVVAALVTLIFTRHFPTCFQEGQGLTLFKRVSEYLIAGILLTGIGLVWRRRAKFEPYVLVCMIWSMALTILAELCFTLYRDVFGLFNQLGHYLKILSFYLIYKAVMENSLTRPYEVLFKDLARSRADIQASQERLRSVYHNIPLPTLTWQARDGDFVLMDYNQAMEEVTLKRVTDYLGRPAREIYEDMPEIQADLAGCYAQKDVRHRATSYRFRSTGLTRFMIITYAYVPPDMVLTHFDDVTEQKAAEELKDEVDRITRHDLKTPLSAVVGLPMVLLLDDNLTPAQRELLEHIRASGYRMLNLINLSLDLYHMERGTYTLEPQPVDLAEVVRKILEENSLACREKDLRVEVAVEGGAPGNGSHFVVLGEELLCYTMLGNLIKNALEASPPGGSLSVQLCRGEACRVTVRNQGEVPEPVRDKFFEKYATHGKKGGTGLGTYSARLIAETQGGSISMTTGQGETAVTVELSAAEG
ncbi:MAG: PAS domain-containing protein [Deltaproteobacteria bacterium]|nr:PAS domain-containing protein [Deltaproteobacteria bacterium]